jgi:HlyD family secretion protein
MRAGLEGWLRERGLDPRGLTILVTSMVLAATLVCPPLAQGSDAVLQATGVLRQETVTASVHPALALLVADATATNTAQAFQRAGRSRGPKPVGRVVWFGPDSGDAVRTGEPIARIDQGAGRLFAARSTAEIDVARTGVDAVEEAREKILDAIDEAEDARSQLLDARATAKAQFAGKSAQGAAQARSLKDRIALLGRTRPPTDPELMGAKQALAKLQGGLSAGEAAFDTAMAKIADGLAKIADAVDTLETQYDVLGHKADSLRARVRQLQAIDRAARVLMREYTIRAPRAGVLSARKAERGQLVFANQAVATIAPKGKLVLDLFVGYDEVRDVRVGQIATVRVDGVARDFAGRVRRVHDAVRFAPTNAVTPRIHLSRTVQVEVEVTDPSGVLKAGMPADAVVQPMSEGADR